MVRALFGAEVPTMLVDMVLAVVSAAPAWSNLASMTYARRAQGQPKMAILFPLLLAMVACVAALAFVPKNGIGLLLFFLFYASARLLWAGVETVRSVLWSVNYPTRARARITGRITINTSIVVAGVGMTLGWLVGREGPWWRVALLAGCVCGLAGTFAFRRVRVRREASLLEAERARLREGARFGFDGMRELLARDTAFRDYQMAMAMFGAGVLSLTPILVVCLNEVLRLPTLLQVAVTTALPVMVMPVAVQPWARYLDRHRVVAFRALHGRVTTTAVGLLAAAVLLPLPLLLWPGALLLGVSMAAGSLGWTLGHNDFAPRGEEIRYMALHVTLTGIRGLIAPPLTMGVFHLLEWSHRGWGPYAVLIPFGMVLS
ncbi:MAG: hypothetical protein ACR2I8_01855, partial [Steroidobacteraceae bacterium]